MIRELASKSLMAGIHWWST